MTAGLTVVFTPRATKQTQRALVWWRQNRTAAPELLEQKLRNVLALVAAAPTIGAVARDPRVKGVRRVLLRRTRYRLCYRTAAEAGRLEALALWHASRRDPVL